MFYIMTLVKVFLLSFQTIFFQGFDSDLRTIGVPIFLNFFKSILYRYEFETGVYEL